MISVCIATFNGEKYIGDQISSILNQLDDDDEIIIQDDSSTDGTVDVLCQINDQRIKIQKNIKNVGYVRNYELALNRCKGDYIFFSDQDDIWPAGRVVNMIATQKSTNKNLIVGGYSSFDNHNKDKLSCFFETRTPWRARDESKYLNYIYFFWGSKIPYFGSCMLITKNSLSYLLPFLKLIGSHDHWIFLNANFRNDIAHLNDVVTLRRVHGGNITNSNRKFHQKLLTRFIWILTIIEILRR